MKIKYFCDREIVPGYYSDFFISQYGIKLKRVFTSQKYGQYVASCYLVDSP